MRRLLLGLLTTFLALPVFAADITATTGWTCINSNEPSGSPTIDSGSNRKFVMWGIFESNTDPAPTITVGGVAETEELTFFYSPTSTVDHHAYVQIWNESAIGSMSGTTISYSDSSGAFNKAFCYGTIEDTDQANLSSFTGTNNVDTGSSLAVTSTSSSGDYLVCSGIKATDGADSFDSWDTLTEFHDDDGGDGWRAGYGEGDGGDNSTTITVNDSADAVTGQCLTFPNTGPSFTSGPTETPATNGFTIGGTLSGSGTLTAYAVGVNPADGTPTCSNIKSGHHDGGSAADLSANEVWTTDVANDFLLTKSGAWPRYDIHVCGSDGTTDTSVTSFAGQDRSDDSGQGIQEITSAVSTTSPFNVQSVATADTTLDSAVVADVENLVDYLQDGMRVDMTAGFSCSPCIVENVGTTTFTLEEAAGSNQTNTTAALDTYYSPTVVGGGTGDVVELDDQTSASKTVTLEADGDLVITDMGSAYQTIDYNIQDVSDVIDGDFDSGPPAWTTGDDKFYLNASRPNFDQTVEDPILVIKDEAMTTYTFTCTDPESLTLTWNNRTSLPTGLSLGSSNGQLTGTPTVENETTGTTPTIDCYNAAGLYSTRADTTIFVSDDSVTMPTITGDTVAAALVTLAATYKWLDITITTKAICSADEVAGDIVNQSPTASSTTTATPTFTADVSVGTEACSRRRRNK